MSAPTMRTFQEIQEERDQLARTDGAMGDPARRWTTCECGETSPEFVYYGEVDYWEDWHQCRKVIALRERKWDDVLEDWEFPKLAQFEHRIEPFEGFHTSAKHGDDEWLAPVHRIGVPSRFPVEITKAAS
jgi:hypothetical protein